MTTITLTPLSPTPFGQTSVDPEPFTPPILIGDGDEQHTSVATTGSMMDIRTGTSSAVDTSQNPALKVTRTLAFPAGTFANAATEQNAAIMGIGVSLDPGCFQPIGVLGVSKQYSTQGSATGDALGVMGIGRAGVDAPMAVYGGFFAARREVGYNQVDVTTVEFQCQNLADSDDYAFNGDFNTRAMTIHAAGTNGGYSAVGISFHRTNVGTQFDVGIGFSQAAGGPECKTACLRFDQTVPYGLYFGNQDFTVDGTAQRGCYTGAIVMEDATATQVTAAVVAGGGSGYAVNDVLEVAGGTGTKATLTVATLSGSAVATVTVTNAGSYTTAPTNPVGVTPLTGVGTGATFTLTTGVVINNALLMGVTSRAGTAVNAMMVLASSYSATGDPIMWVGSTEVTAGVALSHYNRFGNGNGEMWQFAAGATNDFGTGVTTGDTGIQLRSLAKAYHIMVSYGSSAVRQKIFTVVNGDTGTPDVPPKIAFFGVTPVPRGGAAVGGVYAYTQTYATASKTVAALTSADLTGITSSTTGSALAEPGAAYTQSEMQQNFRRLQDQVNALRADMINVKQVQNSLIDDSQAYGLAQ